MMAVTERLYGETVLRDRAPRNIVAGFRLLTTSVSEKRFRAWVLGAENPHATIDRRVGSEPTVCRQEG
jgi:hypothetical protein